MGQIAKIAMKEMILGVTKRKIKTQPKEHKADIKYGKSNMDLS